MVTAQVVLNGVASKFCHAVRRPQWHSTEKGRLEWLCNQGRREDSCIVVVTQQLITMPLFSTTFFFRCLGTTQLLACYAIWSLAFFSSCQLTVTLQPHRLQTQSWWLDIKYQCRQSYVIKYYGVGWYCVAKGFPNCHIVFRTRKWKRGVQDGIALAIALCRESESYTVIDVLGINIHKREMIYSIASHDADCKWCGADGQDLEFVRGWAFPYVTRDIHT